MHIEKVNYQKVFNLGSYQSERIGVELVLNKGEDAKFALEEAKKLVEEFHQENQSVNKVEPEFENGLVVQNIKSTPKKTISEKTKELINNCVSEDELKSWKMMAETHKLMDCYNDKLKTFKIKK
jgi:organic radical activating enzyme